MGATRFQTAIRVVTPAALSGIAAAYILGISRAVGETMILAVAAGMQPNLTWNPMEPAATITAYHRAGRAGRSAARQHRLPDHFRRGPDADAADVVLQHRRSLPDAHVTARCTDMDRHDRSRRIRALITKHKRWDMIFATVGRACADGRRADLRRAVRRHGDRRSAPAVLGFLHQLSVPPCRSTRASSRPGSAARW